jgi:hypothetical protein
LFFKKNGKVKKWHEKLEKQSEKSYENKRMIICIYSLKVMVFFRDSARMIPSVVEHLVFSFQENVTILSDFELPIRCTYEIAN